jgi:two-component system, NarL family, sensor histidine kinase FusK
MKVKKGLRENVWLTQMFVAAGYALAYLTVRPFSDAQWTLTSGLRVACLLLVPYRFWPALVLGEVFPLTYWNHQEGVELGWVWMVLASVPPIIVGMPIVWWCRHRLALFPSRRLINIGALLQCLLFLSTAWAFISYLLYLTASPSHYESEMAAAPAIGTVMYFLGNYLGMVAILPWALLARLEPWQGQLCFKLKQLFASRMSRDIFSFVLPSMGAFFALSYVDHDGIGKVARAAMLLPVAWLTLKHGWRASLLGSTFVVTCVCMLFACKPDEEMLQVQSYVVIAVTCLYALGAHVSSRCQQKEQVTSYVRQAQQVAKSSLNFGERHLEQASRALECVLDVLGVEQLNMSEKLRHVATDTERKVYDKQASLLQRRIFHLAESIHPSAWRLGGVQAALRDSVGRVLNEAGLSYRFKTKGQRSGALSPSIQVAIYRSVCAAVASVSSDLACASIEVMMREGTTQGHQWVMLRIDGKLSELAIARNVCLAEERERVAPKLGAHALDFQDLRNLIQLFDGELRIREEVDRVRVTALLFDGTQRVRGSATAFAPPLWVS